MNQRLSACKNQMHVAAAVVLLMQFSLPQYSVAAGTLKTDSQKADPVMTESLATQVPASPEYKVVRTLKIPVTAYNSLPGQTDNSPCITANGFDLCKNNEENVIAANFLRFKTKVRFPELFGDRIFTVQDRMNARYDKRADIWFRNYDDARKFGIKYTTIEIVEEVKADEELALK